MIVVLALDRGDGWFFARAGERILLLRPPYRIPEAQVVSAESVAQAVMHHDYTEDGGQFPSWAAAIDFVRQEVAEQRKREGRPLPEEAGRALIKVAPASMVERFLDRVESELLPNGELSVAESFLLTLQIESPRLRESHELTRRTAELMAKVLRARKLRQGDITANPKLFRRLTERGTLEASRRIGEKIARTGSMFAH